jgi:pseudouridine-5'-phosphate glycosidase
MSDSTLHFHPEVAQARAEGRAVVVLESTIISHGMPYPQNLETAREVEACVRASGAVPATIAVMAGKIVIGLDATQLERLATDKGALKVSRRDLAYALSSGMTGATTVAATMIAAHMAGIRVFATGGIGGVHRGGETSLDISADLEELAQTPVAVVCAGAKAILDLPRTLEYLETRGVPVVGYQTDEFPAFYSRRSDLGVDFRMESPAAVADLLRAQWALGLKAGVLIANPIPPEHALPEAEIAAVIDLAVADAERDGIRGKDVSPYLLQRIVETTGGASLRANIALVKNNASLAGHIACELE